MVACYIFYSSYIMISFFKASVGKLLKAFLALFLHNRQQDPNSSQLKLIFGEKISTKFHQVRLATVQLSRKRLLQFSKHLGVTFSKLWLFCYIVSRRNHNIWWIKNVSRNHLSIMLIFACMLILSSSSLGSCLLSSHAHYWVNAYFRETTVGDFLGRRSLAKLFQVKYL